METTHQTIIRLESGGLVMFTRSIKILLILPFIMLLAACNAKVTEVTGPRLPDYQIIAESRTVVFIHGMYLTPTIWDGWEERFQAAGYATHSPAWPVHELSVEEQNALHPNTELAALTLSAVLQHYREFIATLDEEPILIGHSMGGLVVQLLLAEGVGAGGIAIDSAPPFGVISVSPVFLKANFPHLNPLASASRPVKLTFEQFQFGFANGMPEEQQLSLYQEHMVPESRRIGRSTLTLQAKVNTKTARVPLLLIAGGKDHTIPAGLSNLNFQIYGDTPAITDYKMFPDRNHLIIVQDAWEQVADYALTWIEVNQIPILIEDVATQAAMDTHDNPY